MHEPYLISEIQHCLDPQKKHQQFHQPIIILLRTEAVLPIKLKEHRKATVPHVTDIYFPKDFTSKQAYSLRTVQED